MNAVRRFLRMRRQSGAVKAGLLFFALAAVLLGVTEYRAVQYADMLRAPYELILSASGSDAEQSPAAAQLRLREDVLAVSAQKTVTVTVNNVPLETAVLSPEYLAESYGLAEAGSGTVWCSAAAMQAIFPYSPGGGRVQCETDGSTRTLRFALCDALPADAVFAVMPGSTADRAGADILRVRMRSRDLNNTAVNAIRTLGFGIVNQTALLTADYEQKLLLTVLRWGLLSAALAAIAGAAFYVPAARSFRRNEASG